jgi:hypothetical protein
MRIRRFVIPALCGAILGLGLLAACTPSPQPALPGAFTVLPVAAAHCHVPASGKPEELAERGIGGTGGATRPPPPKPIRPSLGVAGIIDGFGSVCLDGLEIGLLPGTTVSDDGGPATADDLRIGQQAVLAAGWTGGRPVTDHLMIQHAIIGPIDQIDGSLLLVAGQTVLLSPHAWIDVPLRHGQWVSVSGLRMPAGDILASRLDPASGPEVLIHGRLQGTLAAPRIGRLPVVLAGAGVSIGSDVPDDRAAARSAGGRPCRTVRRTDPSLPDPDPGCLGLSTCGVGQSRPGAPARGPAECRAEWLARPPESGRLLHPAVTARRACRAGRRWRVTGPRPGGGAELRRPGPLTPRLERRTDAGSASSGRVSRRCRPKPRP